MSSGTTSGQKSLPSYVTTTIGPPDFSNIAMRLRGIAAFLAANGMPEAAEYAAKAYGSLMGSMASGSPKG